VEPEQAVAAKSMTSEVKMRDRRRQELDLGGHFPYAQSLRRIVAMASQPQPLPFGVLLRRWRERRRMSQADLAFAADSSTRHLSCLETGRSKPSREMVLRLSTLLDVPLRDQNTLLLAAGLAPAFEERELMEMGSARLAIDQVLQAHKPYPAFAVDRHWNVVLSNNALPQLYEACSPDLLRRPVNAVRLILHPLGMAPRLVNFVEWRAHTIDLLRAQLDATIDPVIQGLLSEVMAYPAPPGAAGVATFEGPQRYATPIKIRTRLGTVSFITTNTIFGVPTDVTLSELSLEMFFPADADTMAVVRSMVDESASDERESSLHKAG
jgi:transcriptional regulator with XRE-family HTH domain